EIRQILAGEAAIIKARAPAPVFEPPPAAAPPAVPAPVAPGAPLPGDHATIRVMLDAHDPNDAFAAAAAKNGLPPALVRAVAWQESRGNPAAQSAAGAVGLMQLLPGTAKNLG